MISTPELYLGGPRLKSSTKDWLLWQVFVALVIPSRFILYPETRYSRFLPNWNQSWYSTIYLCIWKGVVTWTKNQSKFWCCVNTYIVMILNGALLCEPQVRSRLLALKAHFFIMEHSSICCGCTIIVTSTPAPFILSFCQSSFLSWLFV